MYRNPVSGHKPAHLSPSSGAYHANACLSAQLYLGRCLPGGIEAFGAWAVVPVVLSQHACSFPITGTDQTGGRVPFRQKYGSLWGVVPNLCCFPLFTVASTKFKVAEKHPLSTHSSPKARPSHQTACAGPGRVLTKREPREAYRAA